ncbi:glycoside hydrolase family 43 protein [Algibacillus agarilyticus]|uniref:glycoside hydrolase family 43 protein n=1 Tax=Algibacillus agarilyticus TaxID=2234133 RepID=UPI001E3E2B13|nr:glycoside hydrolase family 43 protein [Algibacillus agarilyticus]
MPTNSDTNTLAETPMTYNNPLVEQRADPWIYKDTDETYYFIGSVPEFDRIILRSAKTINGLTNAAEKTVWRKHTTGPMSKHIWAPELHKIDDKWYIYFAASRAEDIWHISMYALSNSSANPMEGEWIEEGQVDSGWENFALDATTFKHKGKRYMIWAQSNKERSYNTALWMAEMTGPTSIDTSNVIVLTKPELAWETIGYKVNEGPAVIIRNGKVFVTYSASATDHNYAMGLLWADVDSDLMNEASWHKNPTPVLSTNEDVKRYGPGHNGFTVAEDGVTDLLIYHARDYRDLIGDPLSDPNRHARIRKVNWDENGFPVFGQALDD